MSRHPGNKHRYNEATKILKDHIKMEEETFQTHLQSLTATAADTDCSLWKTTKRLKQLTQRIHQSEKGPHLGPK
jgi:hypothetical protein